MASQFQDDRATLIITLTVPDCQWAFSKSEETRNYAEATRRLNP